MGLRFAIPVALLIGGASVVLANSFGPQLSRTGAPALGAIPAEPTCNDVACHAGNLMNFNGTLEIIGVPEVYNPGQAYPLTVRLSSTATQFDSSRRWGFELTAARTSDGGGAGSFSSPDLLIRTGDRGTGNRPYISHDGGSLMQGTTSPAEWSFTWTAPDPGVGTLGFYAAGNAANGNNTSTGDFIYTVAVTVSSMTPVQATTWGKLKVGRLFRPDP